MTSFAVHKHTNATSTVERNERDSFVKLRNGRLDVVDARKTELHDRRLELRVGRDGASILVH
jgi:hypothetical protein